MISYTAAPCYKVTNPKKTVLLPYDDPAGVVGPSMPKLCEIIGCAMPSSSTASHDPTAATSDLGNKSIGSPDDDPSPEEARK
ncbi:hypothetical protein RHSIM_Rhsim08G0235000 [Rhododendron simsii]|uniref:Uncharacterized protein n=1 Tax=Rhododendron simsii TaxID=118357 RepID=A0A834GK93_RHOSS|nr:hypothetical protein RHSIM_Rhsim08G0235000 [Rhododendron simsii]